MLRRPVPVCADHLDALELAGCPCTGCLAFELEPVRRRALLRDEQRLAAKRAWVREVLGDWGGCGQVALADGRPVGLVLYAPVDLLPGADPSVGAPVSEDAVLLTHLWVAGGHRDAGLGRMLVQGMCRDLVGRDVVAVEALAGRGHGPTARSCRVPADYLRRVGFRPSRPHPTHPLLRLDLRTTLPWRDVGAAVERWWEAVRPAPAYPAPDARFPAAQGRRGRAGLATLSR